jgi:hypothetical protein
MGLWPVVGLLFHLTYISLSLELIQLSAFLNGKGASVSGLGSSPGKCPKFWVEFLAPKPEFGKRRAIILLICQVSIRFWP